MSLTKRQHDGEPLRKYECTTAQVNVEELPPAESSLICRQQGACSGDWVVANGPGAPSRCARWLADALWHQVQRFCAGWRRPAAACSICTCAHARTGSQHCTRQAGLAVKGTRVGSIIEHVLVSSRQVAHSMSRKKTADWPDGVGVSSADASYCCTCGTPFACDSMPACDIMDVCTLHERSQTQKGYTPTTMH